MRKIIALYDSDSIYAARFMEYFQNKQEFEWEVVAFTKREKLEDFLLGHKATLLLIESEEIMKSLPEEYASYCYRLTEERHEVSSEQNIIFRYQSVEHIMEQMLSDYMRRQDEISVSMNPKQIKITTVFSPVPGGQDVDFAWSLGFQLAKQRKTLFLPFELLSLKLFDFIDSAHQGLSEFIFYLKENANTLHKWKELLSYNNNLAYLAGASHGFDLLYLNKEDILRWNELLRTGTDYQNVIFYVGYYMEAGMELLKLSDRVVVIKGQSPYEQEILREWERQTECIGIDLQNPKFRSIYRSWDRSETVTYRSLQELACSLVWQQAQEYLKNE